MECIAYLDLLTGLVGVSLHNFLVKTSLRSSIEAVVHAMLSHGNLDHHTET